MTRRSTPRSEETLAPSPLRGEGGQGELGYYRPWQSRVDLGGQQWVAVVGLRGDEDAHQATGLLLKVFGTRNILARS